MTLQIRTPGPASNPLRAPPPAFSHKRPRLMPRRSPRATPPERPGIRFWPESERPREKLLAQGAKALSDGELIALLLGSGTKGRSAVDIARGLIEEFGTLRELLSADQQRMEKRPGIGKARYAMLRAAVEISRRAMLEPLRETPILDAPDVTRQFLRAQLQDRHYEVFCCIFLDNRHRMLGFEEIFRGTLDGANVYSREIVRQALLYNAASILVAHNHPSGSIDPSPADEGVTRRLREALSLVGVRLLDHFVVGDGKIYSFSEHGLL